MAPLACVASPRPLQRPHTRVVALLSGLLIKGGCLRAWSSVGEPGRLGYHFRSRYRLGAQYNHNAAGPSFDHVGLVLGRSSAARVTAKGSLPTTAWARWV